MPMFRMDFYVRGVLRKEIELEKDSKEMLESLKSISVLKKVKMTKVESGTKAWAEFEGIIDIPQGSKAFFALFKESEEKDPYNIFLRIDINKEAETRERAEREAREWIEETFAKHLETGMGLSSIRVGTPLEFIKKNVIGQHVKQQK